MNSPDGRTRRAAPRIWVTVALVVVVVAVAAAAYALGRDHNTGSTTDQPMAGGSGGWTCRARRRAGRPGCRRDEAGVRAGGGPGA